YNAAGGIVWGVGCVVAGYLAGSSYKQVAHYLGQGGAVAAGVMVVVALVAWRLARRHRDPGRDEPVTGRETAPHQR
ncbi:MAG: hypothetical protein ABIQ59_01755, partial [Nocardioidaceae bacterium]